MHDISYRAVAEKFGEPSSTIFDNLKSLINDFNELLGPIYIKLPQRAEEMRVLADKFSNISNLNGTILTVDGTHIPIDAPKYNSSQYINRKGWHSAVYQIVVDADYIVRDLFGGYPGSCHDSYVYHHSSFKEYVDSAVQTLFFIIGDSAYPSSDKLLTPFRGTLDTDQETYDNRLFMQRIRVECTIGRIKGRFKRFRSPKKMVKRLQQ
ncbi:hypothetical protein ENBRE01_2140 [Enteropsectra breve]|nr:hypothetical protein ENBRE01_2140 [Enteropsectra breve]